MALPITALQTASAQSDGVASSSYFPTLPGAITVGNGTGSFVALILHPFGQVPAMSQTNVFWSGFPLAGDLTFFQGVPIGGAGAPLNDIALTFGSPQAPVVIAVVEYQGRNVIGVATDTPDSNTSAIVSSIQTVAGGPVGTENIFLHIFSTRYNKNRISVAYDGATAVVEADTAPSSAPGAAGEGTVHITELIFPSYSGAPQLGVSGLTNSALWQQLLISSVALGPIPAYVAPVVIDESAVPFSAFVSPGYEPWSSTMGASAKLVASSPLQARLDPSVSISGATARSRFLLYMDAPGYPLTMRDSIGPVDPMVYAMESDGAAGHKLVVKSALEVEKKSVGFPAYDFEGPASSGRLGLQRGDRIRLISAGAFNHDKVFTIREARADSLELENSLIAGDTSVEFDFEVLRRKG